MTQTEKRLAIVLAVSVAFNLFLCGFIAARTLSGDGHHERGRHGHFLGPRGLMRDDPQAEQTVRRVLERRAAVFGAQRDKLRATRGRVGAAFEAEPFDAQALERALSDLRAQTGESQRLLHESLVEVAPSLTPEQRGRLGRRALDREPGLYRRKPPAR